MQLPPGPQMDEMEGGEALPGAPGPQSPGAKEQN